MSFDISGYGLRAQIIGSVTFPVGFTVTQFADDADSIDISPLQIGDVAMGLNGDLIGWTRANPTKITLNVIPNSGDDQLLSILFQANRPGRGKTSAQDIITLTLLYPDGAVSVYQNGFITDGIPGLGVQNVGRLKTRPYNFAFENFINVG